MSAIFDTSRRVFIVCCSLLKYDDTRRLRFLALPTYEFIRLAGRYDNKFVDILSKPGLCLQGVTTKEPDDSMIEVAIAAVEAIYDWKAYLNENFGTDYEIENKG